MGTVSMMEFELSIIKEQLRPESLFAEMALMLGQKDWQSAARTHALNEGQSIVLRKNGDLRVYTRKKDNCTVSQKTYRHSKWRVKGFPMPLLEDELTTV